MAGEQIIQSGRVSTILKFCIWKSVARTVFYIFHWVKKSFENKQHIYTYTDEQRNILYANDLCKTINHEIEE